MLNIKDNKTIFLICGIFISFDIITGYLKAFKLKKVNIMLKHMDINMILL